AKQRRYDQLFKESQITACDLTPDKERGVEFCDICSLPYQDNSFDNILCIEVLQYLKLEQIKPALKEIKRVLKPAGMAIITMPFFYKDHKDNLRLSSAYVSFLLKELRFFDFQVIRFGNKFTAYYDIMRNSYFKAKFLKPFYLLEATLAFLAIKIFRLEKIKDDFYTGIMIKITKIIEGNP
ncbi:MAG: class I SAM-dependent methyltransferase, partial [bacterium]|nr:class I SAM-dependent methyltransferase [bacterium]